MKNIALFGGSFDPVHIGHIKVAETILQKLPIDQVWFTPAAQHPFKEKTMFTFEERLNFLCEIARRNPSFKVCGEDNDTTQKSYTIHLVKKLIAMYPDYHFSFVIGADNVSSLRDWFAYEELLKLIKFIVLDRAVSNKMEWFKLPYYHRLIFVEMPIIKISSTEIREKILAKKSIIDVLPKEIHHYFTR